MGSDVDFLLVAPIVIISLGLLAWALYDLTRPERKVKGGNKLVWGAIIIFVGTIGPLIYLLAGREDA